MSKFDFHMSVFSEHYRSHGLLRTFSGLAKAGLLAQKFNLRTALEPTMKLSYEALNPHINKISVSPLRQTAVIGSPSVFRPVIRHIFLSISRLNLCLNLR